MRAKFQILVFILSFLLGHMAYGQSRSDISMLESEGKPELIIRDPITDAVDDYFSARVLMRMNAQDFEILGRNSSVAKTQTIAAFRAWVQLPHDQLFIKVTNTLGLNLDWWVKYSQTHQIEAQIADRMRKDIIAAYRSRTKQDLMSSDRKRPKHNVSDDDFIIRQLEAEPFEFHIESLTLAQDTLPGRRLARDAEQRIRSGRLKPASVNYQGFGRDLAQISDNYDESSGLNFDNRMVPKIGELTDLKIGQMWVDRKNNFVVVLGSDDERTGKHYTQAHPFYFGNLSSPDLYQVYSVGRQGMILNQVDGSQKYKEFTLHLADQDETTKPKAVLRFKEGVVSVGTADNYVKLTDADDNQRWVVSQLLKTGNAQLHNLPDTRHAIHVFKLNGSDTYIYVDAPSFSRELESYQMWIGQPGHLKPLPILHIDTIDKKPARFHTPKGILHIATELETSKEFEPTFEATKPDQIFMLTAEQQDEPKEFVPTLQQLGVDLNRLRTANFPSPCDVFLKKPTPPFLKSVPNN